MTNQPESLPFALPEIGEEEIAEVVDCLKSGWLTTGPRTLRFEKDFASFIGVEAALAVSSATAGLHLALACIDLLPGEKVLVPVNTFTATAEVVRWFGAEVVFVDIDPKTMNISPESLEKILNSHPRGTFRAVMPVHIGGLACAMEAILPLARQFDLVVIEDAAHALPTSRNGKLIGSLESDFTIFSFYVTKTVTTGEGGMLICRDASHTEKAKLLRLHGISREVWDRYTSTSSHWHYDVMAPGFKYNLPDLLSAIGIHQLKKGWAFQKRRQAIATAYDEVMQSLAVDCPPHALYSDTHSWHLYLLRVEPSKRDNLVSWLKEKGVGTSVHFIPLHLMTYWKTRYNLQPQDFPNALESFSRLVSLPIYTRMTDRDVQRVIEGVSSFFS